MDNDFRYRLGAACDDCFFDECKWTRQTKSGRAYFECRICGKFMGYDGYEDKKENSAKATEWLVASS